MDERRKNRRMAVYAIAGFWLLGGIPLAADLAAATPPAPEARGRCEIRFFATSTLHDFSGSVAAEPFVLERHVDASGGEPWWSGVVQVSVADMETGIERRDGNMRSMFEAERFPRIIASIGRVEALPTSTSPEQGRPTIPFELTIRETTRPIEARVSGWEQHGDAASFQAEFDVSLRDFGLEVPPVLGLLRVGDEVRVRTRVSVELPSELADAGLGPA